MRKFRQKIRENQPTAGPGAPYLAKEIHYEELEDGRWRCVMIMADDSRHEGHIIDAKILDLNLKGFDIVHKDKDGKERKSRFTGMLEHSCFEEIVG